MGLDPNDKKPKDVSLAQAYEQIRQWYSKNLPLLRERMGERDYGKRSEALIKVLPPATELTDLEIRAVLGEVICGNLEWGYHETDGQYKMGAYAHGALEAAGVKWSFSDAEKQKLRGSALWPHLMISR